MIWLLYEISGRNIIVTIDHGSIACCPQDASPGLGICHRPLEHLWLLLGGILVKPWGGLVKTSILGRLSLWSSFIVFLRKAFGRFKKMRCSCSCFKDTNLFVPKEKTQYIFTCLETLHPIPPWDASPFFVRPFDTHAHTHTQRSLAGRTFWCPWPTLGVVACGWPRGIERRARAVPLSKLYIVAVQILSNTIQNDFFKTKFSQSTTWKQNHLQEHWISDRQIISTAVMRMFQSLGFH